MLARLDDNLTIDLKFGTLLKKIEIQIIIFILIFSAVLAFIRFKIDRQTR